MTEQRPLSMIHPEQSIAVILQSEARGTSAIHELLDTLGIVTLSKPTFLETFTVSGSLLQVLGDPAKRQLILIGRFDQSEILPSALWSLEHGLDVFIAVDDLDLESSDHVLLHQRLTAAGATVMTVEQCQSELAWSAKSKS